MANVAGRLAEVLTDNCTGTQYTDEGFSYTVRGEVSDVYESTPHSGGYYHVNASYWADGVMNTLSGIPGVHYDHLRRECRAIHIPLLLLLDKIQSRMRDITLRPN